MSDRTCSIDGCEGERYSRGWCHLHYHRWYHQQAALRPTVGCSVPDCERPSQTKGMCQAHYVRTWRGAPLDQPLRPYSPGAECSVEGCDRIVQSRGMCEMHAKRDRLHGDPFHEHPRPNNWKPLPGELNPNYGGDLIDYHGAHQRIRSTRGPAARHVCVHCGGQARGWAYDHLDPAEKLGGPNGALRFSTDPDHYIPLCVPCHMRFDKKGK